MLVNWTCCNSERERERKREENRGFGPGNLDQTPVSKCPCYVQNDTTRRIRTHTSALVYVEKGKRDSRMTERGRSLGQNERERDGERNSNRFATTSQSRVREYATKGAHMTAIHQ